MILVAPRKQEKALVFAKLMSNSLFFDFMEKYGVLFGAGADNQL